MCGEVNISVTAYLSVSDETAQRCMKLLEMWMDDNPNKSIVCDIVPCANIVRHKLRIQTLEKVKENE